MQMASLERIILVSVVALLIGLGYWMQHGLQIERHPYDSATAHHQRDYYVKNFVAKGWDGLGTSYVLRSAYLEYFLDDKTVDIKEPCLLLFEKGVSPRLIFADAGRIIENGAMIVLNGNVEVREDLPANIGESVLLPQDASSTCFSPDVRDGTWTRADKLMLQLKSGPER
jgi:LPS export ABC transporter protein LptC